MDFKHVAGILRPIDHCDSSPGIFVPRDSKPPRAFQRDEQASSRTSDDSTMSLACGPDHD